jgi:hypothetical protein
MIILEVKIIRNYEKELKREKELYGRFHTKIEKVYFQHFEGIVKADFLRWCVDNKIVDKFKEMNKTK